MSKPSLEDVHNHLAEQLDRLKDPELTGGALDEEIRRAHAMCGVTREIVSNGRLVLDVVRHRDEMGAPGQTPKFMAPAPALRDETAAANGKANGRARQ